MIRAPSGHISNMQTCRIHTKSCGCRQEGGSKNDAEVIKTLSKLHYSTFDGIALHFRHGP